MKIRLALLSLVMAVALGAWFWLRWLEQTHDLRYTLVEDGLYIGGSVNEPPPGTQAVVNLCGREDPYSVEASLWTPTFEGGPEPDLQWLTRAVDFIVLQRNSGRQVYVHCLSGMNRSGAVMTAYLMHEHNWTRDKALAFLQRKRNIVQPNPTLMRLLTEWEEARANK